MLLMIILIVALPILLIFIVDKRAQSNFSERLALVQAKRESFRKTFELDELATGADQSIGVNRKRKAVVVFDAKGRGFWVPFDRIASVELVREYETRQTSLAESRTNRGSQLIGAAVGSAIAGPAGLVVGGLSGKTTTQSHGSSTQRLRAAHLKLRLYSNDTPSLSLALQDEAIAERIAARIQNEIDFRGIATVAKASMASQFEAAVASDSPASALQAPQRGWWQETFG